MLDMGNSKPHSLLCDCYRHMVSGLWGDEAMTSIRGDGLWYRLALEWCLFQRSQTGVKINTWPTVSDEKAMNI